MSFLDSKVHHHNKHFDSLGHDKISVVIIQRKLPAPHGAQTSCMFMELRGHSNNAPLAMPRILRRPSPRMTMDSGISPRPWPKPHAYVPVLQALVHGKMDFDDCGDMCLAMHRDRLFFHASQRRTGGERERSRNSGTGGSGLFGTLCGLLTWARSARSRSFSKRLTS